MIATKDFTETETGDKCSTAIKKGLEALNTTTADNFDLINQIFTPCTPIDKLETIYDLTTYLSNGFLYMAMTDYPYESSFLEPMPANPVNVSCESFAAYDPVSSSIEDIWRMLKEASDVYFNYNVTPPACSDLSDPDATGNLDGAGWDVLACNQLAMPTAMGADSMFLTEPFDYTKYTQGC